MSKTLMFWHILPCGYFLTFSRLPLVLRRDNQEKAFGLQFLLNLYFCEGLDDITCLNIVTVNE